MRSLILAALIASAIPAQAADRCHDLAAMYQMAHSLRDSGLTDAQIAGHGIASLPLAERLRAVERVKTTGDLGYLSAKTLYRHVYLECRGGA
jgi:hypothetical protein